jgi:glycosyltransferase involved in cell wall biosynthesis
LAEPEVSVALPFRDAGAWIGAALESLASQTFDDFEVLMVDDGSTDDGPRTAASFASRDPRFRLLRAGGSGIVQALNQALASARGRWIARMDADDVCHRGRLEAQLRLAEESGPGTVVSCLVRCSGTPAGGWRFYESWVNSLVDPEEIGRAMFVESPIPHPTAFFDRDAVAAAGGYAEGPFPEDYELWLRLWAAGTSFRKVPEVLLDWRERPDRLSRTSPRYSTEAFFALKARYLGRSPVVAGRREVILWGPGTWGRRFHDLLAREGIRVESFVDINPRRIGGTIRGRPVISPRDPGLRRGLPVLVCVRSRGASAEIAGQLEAMGLSGGVDYLLCT